MAWLNASAPRNTYAMFVTRPVFQALMPSAPIIERSGSGEHVYHAGHFGHVPGANVLVEGLGSVEHALHVGNFGRVPLVTISWDGLIERRCVREDVCHAYHEARLPGLNAISPAIVECSGRPEHGEHVGHFGHVPGADVLVEGAGSVEHALHAGHFGRVPLVTTGWDGLVERRRILEHVPHACHEARLPGLDAFSPAIVERS